MTDNQQGAHHPGIDGLRGIAILTVLCYHFGAAHLPAMTGVGAVPRALVSLGWAGVDLFFVLSGFLITDILLRTREAPRYFRNFWGRRVLRILPVYFLVLVCCLYVVPAVVPGMDVEVLRARQAWLWTFTSNIWVFEHGVWGFSTSSFDLNPTWSLAIEEQFYLVWPVVVWIVGRRRLLPAIIVMLVLGLALRCWMVAEDAEGGGAVVVYTFTPARLDGLLLGALVAIKLPQVRALPQRGLLTCLILLAFLLVTALFVARGTEAQDPWISTIGFSLIAITGVALLVAGLRPWVHPTLARALSARLLRTFGKYSYAIYLFDGVVRPSVGRFIDELWISSELMQRSPWLTAMTAIIVGSLISFALAVASWHLLEVRFLRLKDRYFRSDRE